MISAGGGYDYVVVRNVFYGCDHVAQVKSDSFMTFVNNTVADVNVSALYFLRPTSTTDYGRGAYVDGSIFRDTALVFDKFTVSTDLTVNHSILPTEWHYLGLDNIDADPIFVDPNDDFHLKSMSPAIGTGPCGLDMGAYLPGGAAICGEPDEVTYRTDATLTVDGPGITHYKYCINDSNGPWFGEFPVDTLIELNGLANGQSYTVYVVGKNSAGLWQSQDDAAASRTWTIDVSHSKLIINEVLAINDWAVNHEGTFPDLIELYYDGPASLDLSDMSISDQPSDPRKYVFGAGVTVEPKEYLVLYADSNTTTSGIHLHFALDGGGEGVYLYDSLAGGGGLLDSVEFGTQINDYSIGRVGYDRQWKLNQPTFGYSNVAQPLGDPATLKINEWLANEEILFDDDFIELFNPHAFPVDLSGLYLTDNPVTQPYKQQVSPLSFVAGEGFAVFRADDQNSPGHVDFRLSADGEIIALYDAELNEIDKVLYGPQTTDASQGRIPDGAVSFEFFELPTPHVANPVLTMTTTTLVVEDANKRVLVPTGPVNDNWMGGGTFDDSGWNNGTFIADKTGGVGYETSTGYEPYISYDVEAKMYNGNTSCYIRIPFTFNGDPGEFTFMTLNIRYDDGFVAYLNGKENEIERKNFSGTPYWNSKASGGHEASGLEPITVTNNINSLQQGDNILAIQGLNTSKTSTDFLISAELVATATRWEDDFVVNAFSLLDGLRITEIMYHAPGGSEYDYICLLYTSPSPRDRTRSRMPSSA